MLYYYFNAQYYKNNFVIMSECPSSSITQFSYTTTSLYTFFYTTVFLHYFF